MNRQIEKMKEKSSVVERLNVSICATKKSFFQIDKKMLNIIRRKIISVSIKQVFRGLHLWTFIKPLKSNVFPCLQRNLTDFPFYNWIFKSSLILNSQSWQQECFPINFLQKRTKTFSCKVSYFFPQKIYLLTFENLRGLFNFRGDKFLFWLFRKAVYMTPMFFDWTTLEW